MNPQTQVPAERKSAAQAEGATPRKHLAPVAWLLGRQLLGGIKGILLYAAYGKKLDPRDWMRARVFPEQDTKNTKEQNRKITLEAWRAKHVQEAAWWGREVPTTEDAEKFWQEQGEFWFDYLSDAGDGTKAMYSLAYLCMSNLWVQPLAEKELPACADERNAEDDPCAVKHDKQGGYKMELPRGEFLFIGGDTAYHVSDYMTIAERVQNPFSWAYEDLLRHERIKDGEPARPLFGIPGNHDYYDQLDGFRRQFLMPAKPEPQPLEPDLDHTKAQLSLAGFYRAQVASYVALHLPFDCSLWGLDTEVGQIDDRQEKFFRELCDESKDKLAEDDKEPPDIVPPQKLILATCSPTTAFGKIADPKDYKAADAIGQLRLRQPFYAEKHDGIYDLSHTGDEKINKGQCRLEISGDVHHYARYWGPRPTNGKPPRATARAKAKTATSYASVVSGLGGAFHHPSTTYNDEIQEQVLYPNERTSRNAVAERVFNVWNIMRGGYVWLAGAIIAFIICFAATVPQSSRQFLSNIPLLQRLGLKQETITPTTYSLPENFSRTPSVTPSATPDTAMDTALSGAACKPVDPFFFWRKRGVAAWQPPLPCKADSPRYFFTADFSWPWDLHLGIWLVILSLVPIGLTIYWSDRIFGTAAAQTTLGTESRPSEVVQVHGEWRIRRSKRDPEIDAHPDLILYSVTILTSALAFLGLASIEPYRAHFTPFVSSLVVLFSLIWASGATVLSLRYSEFLFKRSHQHAIHWWDWQLPGVLTVLSVLSVAFGLWAFGRNNLAALLISDIAFLLVLFSLLLLPKVLPFMVGGELLQPARGAGRKVAAWFGKLFIGVWHVVLQLGVPFILVMRGTPLAWALAAVLVLVLMLVGKLLLKGNGRAGLLLAWFIYGALMLALPCLISPANATTVAMLVSAYLPDWLGWLQSLVPALLAGGVGALLCCAWFGWYLGVCFAFNGHNNEVGGAARIENFKEFIRFRVAPDGITGYVIAVDDVSMIDENVKDAQGKDATDDKGKVIKKDGEYLVPHLIDVFHLTLKGADAGGA